MEIISLRHFNPQYYRQMSHTTLKHVHNVERERDRERKRQRQRGRDREADRDHEKLLNAVN